MASICNTAIKDIFVTLAPNSLSVLLYTMQVHSSREKSWARTASDQALLKYWSVLIKLRIETSSVCLVVSLFALLQNLHPNLVNTTSA